MVRTLLLVAGLAVVVLLFIRLGPGELAALLAGLGWAVLVFPVLYAVHQGLRTLALAAALHAHGSVSFTRLLLIRLSGEALQYLTFTGPLLAEPAKAWMLRREGLESSDAVSATVTEYLAFTCTASLLSLAGLVTLRLTVPLPLPVRIAVSGTAIGLAVLLLLVLLGLWRRWPMAAWTVARLRDLPWVSRRVTVSPEWVRELEGHVTRNLRDDRVRLRRIAVYETAAQSLIVLELYLLLRLFGVAVTPAVILIVEGLNKISNFLFFFVPARAGTDEATLVIVTGALGVPAVVGLGISLVRRGRSLLTGAAGLAAAWALSRGRPSGGAGPPRT
jgi:hypothetical protein